MTDFITNIDISYTREHDAQGLPIGADVVIKRVSGSITKRCFDATSDTQKDVLDPILALIKEATPVRHT